MRRTELCYLQSSSLCASPRTPYQDTRGRKLSDYRARSHSRPRFQQKNNSTIETTIHWPESSRTPDIPPTTIFNTSRLGQHRMPRRNRIFHHLPEQYQHFTVGATLSNLQFEDLDSSLSLCLLSSACGCEESTRCCERIMNFTNLSKARQMKKKYCEIKERRQLLPYHTVRIRMQDVPSGYPQILLPHVENLMRLIPLKNTYDLKLLLTVVWHARVEYLAYWIYHDLMRSSCNENFTEEVLQLISNNSSDLKKYLESSSHDIAGLSLLFQQSRGSIVIPTSQYARYLQALNEEGKRYPERVFFCMLLYCKKRLCEGKLDLNSLFMVPERANQLPWQRIFSAAKNPKLK